MKTSETARPRTLGITRSHNIEKLRDTVRKPQGPVRVTIFCQMCGKAVPATQRIKIWTKEETWEEWLCDKHGDEVTIQLYPGESTLLETIKEGEW